MSEQQLRAAETDDVVRYDRHGPVAVVTINRPGKANALNRAVLDRLDELVDATRGDDEVRAVVVTGAGEKAFSAGADISELAGLSTAAARAFMRRGQDVFDRLEALPVPVIAAIRGVAFGGGLELAMACDIRIAAADATLGQPEITLANLPGWGGTQRLPRLVGTGRALELIFSGHRIDAAEGWRIGLINRVVPAADVVSAAVDLASELAGHSRHALAGAKTAVHCGLDAGTARGLAAEADAVAFCCGTEEQAAAVSAFLNKRGRGKMSDAGHGDAGDQAVR
jgi:enoyl-CoA hydratase